MKIAIQSVSLYYKDGQKIVKTILPYVGKPEAIVVQLNPGNNKGEVFLLNPAGEYHQATWAIATTTKPDEAYLVIELRLKDGSFVSKVYIPAVKDYPNVVIWGSRLFRLIFLNNYEEIFYCFPVKE